MACSLQGVVTRLPVRADAVEEFECLFAEHAAAVLPAPATHAILTQLKAGECIRHSI